MKKLIAAIAFLFIALAGLGQKRYYASTDYGWQEQRRIIVSALGIPTGNGTPTVVNSVDSARAFVYYDSTNAKFYLYNPKAKTWGELSGGGTVDVSGKVDKTTNLTINDTTKDLSGDRVFNIDLASALAKGFTANSKMELLNPAGGVYLTYDALGTVIAIDGVPNAANAYMRADTLGTAKLVAHAGSATEGGVVTSNNLGYYYMGSKDDEVYTYILTDTSRTKISQLHGMFTGEGRIDLRFPIRQDVGSNNFTQDIQPQSGTIALTKNIGDSLAKNNLNIVIGGNVGDSTAGMPNDSTLVFKNFVAGWGLKKNATGTTDSTYKLDADSLLVETKADSRRKIDSLAAALSVGGGSQTPWTSHINAANYGVDSVGRYTGYRRTGTVGGATENKLLYSEQLDNGVWDAGSNVSVSAANVANDLEGNATLDALTCTFAGSNTFGQTITTTPGDSLIISFDAQLPGTGAITNAFYQVYNNDAFSDIVLASYFSSLSTSVTRIKFGVLIPSGCNSVRVRVFGDGSSTGTIHIGRVQAAEAWANGYIETTGTAAPVSGGGGFTYTPTVLFDSSGRIMLNAVNDSSLSLRTNSIDRLTINKDGGWLVNGSAGTAGQVLQSNGSAAAPTWVSLPTSAATLTTPRSISGVPFDGSADINVTETENAVVYKADFITAATGSNPPFTFTAVSSGTSAANITNINANHPGIIRLTSSTTANGGFRVYTDITAIQIGGGEEYVCVFAPVNFTTTTFRAGFLDATTSADVADGLYFEYSTSGALVFKTASNSSRTTSATLATLSLNTWYKVKLVVNSNATSVTGYLYDAAGALLGSETITTNIPTGSARVTGSGIIATESTTTATAMVDIDYQHVKLKPVR